jgi:hypothetical protein
MTCRFVLSGRLQDLPAADEVVDFTAGQDCDEAQYTPEQLESGGFMDDWLSAALNLKKDLDSDCPSEC